MNATANIESTYRSEIGSQSLKKIFERYFKEAVCEDIELDKYLKIYSRFLIINTKTSFSEVFLDKNSFPLILLVNSPLNAGIGDLTRFNFFKPNGAELYKSLRENYYKWVIIKSPAERIFYSKTILNYINRSVTKNEISLQLIHAIMLADESSGKNITKAFEILDHLKSNIHAPTITAGQKNELLYYTSLFSGFIFLENNDLDSAKFMFEESLTFQPSGVNAKFYLSLTELKKGNKSEALKYVDEIFNCDIRRIEMAIGDANLSLIDYSVRYPFIINLTKYYEFLPLKDEIEELFENYKNSSEASLIALKAGFSLIEELKIEEYLESDIYEELICLKKLIEKYTGSNDILINISFEKMCKKFDRILKKISASIRAHFKNEITQKISQFELRKLKYNLNIDKLREDMEIAVTKNKEKLSEILEAINNRFVSEISELEKVLAGINDNPKYNPINSLKNSMAYTIAITVLIFMIGGAAGYSDSASTWNFSDLVKLFLSTGFKWGFLSLIIGTFISLGAAGLVLLDLSENKQNLLRELSRLKNLKEHDIEHYKSAFVKKEQDYQARFIEQIEKNKEIILQFEKDKDVLLAQLNEEAESKMSPILEKLLKINLIYESPEMASINHQYK
jgi:hypothetical protein